MWLCRFSVLEFWGWILAFQTIRPQFYQHFIPGCGQEEFQSRELKPLYECEGDCVFTRIVRMLIVYDGIAFNMTARFTFWESWGGTWCSGYHRSQLYAIFFYYLTKEIIIILNNKWVSSLSFPYVINYFYSVFRLRNLLWNIVIK